MNSLIAPAKVCKNIPNGGNASRAQSSMACFTNYARKKKGLRTFSKNRKLNRSAKKKAGDILRCNSFSHSACGRDFAHWIKRSGYTKGRCWTAGENIAWGNGGLGSTRRIFRAWMNSTGHRRAILSRDFKDVGIGLRNGTLSGNKGARVWVQHFGKRC